MMNKKEFLILIIITFVVIVAWIVADLLHSKSEVPIDPRLQQLLTPVDTNFDQVTLEKIKQIHEIKKTQTQLFEQLQNQPATSSSSLGISTNIEGL